MLCKMRESWARVNKNQSLNGLWEYRVGKGKFTNVTVPFSALAVGHSECKRKFDVHFSSDKTFLKFDGITYAAKVHLNGLYLGEMLPYSEYEFDITESVKPEDNELLVEIEDISPKFGPTAGWENYSGIIRNVSILYKNNDYIEDVFAHSQLLCDYTVADFVVETRCSLPLEAEFKIELSYEGKNVLSYIQPSDSDFIHQRVNNINLWSLEEPNLYELNVSLLKNGKTLDFYSCNIGFREFSCDKHRFTLNGRHLFLKGVCKHEMYGDSGHCPSDRQIEEDMCRIKASGCNFVRLVHYPHNKKILDIADKIGLLVSEEPGLWWSDTANDEVSSGSLEVLKRTILRDRNHPSIAFWLCFNECKFTEQFLIDSANICRKYDPTRLVSGANCMSNEDTLKYYKICNFDFYTMHPYSQTFHRSLESAKILNDKPLLFTEWGGHFVYNNPKLLSEFMSEMNLLYLNASDEGALAGAFFWCWAEINDFNRSNPACIDGNLCEGLLTYDRKPTLIFDTFCDFVKKIGVKEEMPNFWIEPIKDITFLKNHLNISCLKSNFSTFFEKLAVSECSSSQMRSRNLKIGPVLKECFPLAEIPLLVENNSEYKINCGFSAEKIEIIGAVSISKGYPISGFYGEAVATVIVVYEDESVDEYILKNGVDITTAFTTYQSSRINPVAENAEKVAYFGYDKNFENYILNSIKLDVIKTKFIKEVSIVSSNNNYALLIYGILY